MNPQIRVPKVLIGISVCPVRVYSPFMKHIFLDIKCEAVQDLAVEVRRKFRCWVTAANLVALPAGVAARGSDGAAVGGAGGSGLGNYFNVGGRPQDGAEGTARLQGLGRREGESEGGQRRVVRRLAMGRRNRLDKRFLAC